MRGLVGRYLDLTRIVRALPGVALASAIGVAAFMMDRLGWTRIGSWWVPPLIVALFVGMALRPVAIAPLFAPGVDFSGRTLLRVGVALLGARLTFGDMVSGGFAPVVVAALAVFGTIAFGAMAARWFGLPRDLGLLTGCSVGVCGAAAAMAAGAALPRHPSSDRDIAFTVMGVNAISTLAMVAYPYLQGALHYSSFEMSMFLGGAIHDVAQVAGAGQMMGDAKILADAVMTKLLRVAMLLPAVLFIVWWVTRGGEAAGAARPRPPFFLFGFLTLAALNSLGLFSPAVQQAFSMASGILITVAIAALGIKTSLAALAAIGPRPVALLFVQTAFVALVVVLTIYASRWF
ncbi:putative sulfate exporter family transporter [Vineibacter terrae]|uniref:Putative sulfate exporter family transporter n=2 Tax=Vineibacter terrae TaxID=2586908 RepID=A0A5C8PH95_9HYPH|nr:putative sulfate exporter family transporter [Vineibacter terrae]TXL72669.1 putative sulfate exporter family transporter [Vineibacter terrae]